MTRLLIYVKCKTKPSLLAQIDRAVKKTKIKYARRLSFQEGGFNAEIDENQLWIFLLSLMHDGIVVESVRKLVKKSEVVWHDSRLNQICKSEALISC